MLVPVGVVNVCVINVYDDVFNPSPAPYDFAPATELKAVVLFGTMHKLVAVPSFSHTLNIITLPYVAAVIGIVDM